MSKFKLDKGYKPYNFIFEVEKIKDKNYLVVKDVKNNDTTIVAEIKNELFFEMFLVTNRPDFSLVENKVKTKIQNLIERNRELTNRIYNLKYKEKKKE